MRALVYCYGSRGDVVPYLALAHAMLRSGHQSVLAGPAGFAGLAECWGVPFRPLNDDSLTLLDRADVQEMFLNDDLKGPEQERAARAVLEESLKSYPVVLRDIWRAAQDGADVVVFSQACGEATHQVAERLGVPGVLATLYPHYTPSWHYPSMLLAGPRRYGRILNRLSHVVAHRWPPLRPMREKAWEWRTRTLRLPARRNWWNFRYRPDGGPTPVVHGFSPVVVPPAPDWGGWVRTTGFWRLPEQSGGAAGELAEFLAAGPPTISIGFGSLVPPDPAATGALVRDAVRAVGVRAVVVRGKGGIQVAADDDLFVVDEVPYEWLFPRVRVAVHAGGVGTMAAAMHAGVPQVPVPFHGEQVVWAHRAHELGVATRPVRMRDLDVASLVEAIQRADQQLTDRAGELARRLADEDGAARAVRAVERVLDVMGRA